VLDAPLADAIIDLRLHPRDAARDELPGGVRPRGRARGG
jgi:hypothetical protein